MRCFGFGPVGAANVGNIMWRQLLLDRADF